MNWTQWRTNRRVDRATRKLRQAAILVARVLTGIAEPDSRSAQVSSQAISDAKARIRRARSIIEEFNELSYTLQSRLFRMFERIDECLDYATEAIRYGEFSAAETDLSRTVNEIETMVRMVEDGAHKPHRNSKIELVLDQLTLKLPRTKEAPQGSWEIDIRPLVSQKNDPDDRHAFLL